ncbi:MAG: hypothetical protein WCO33_03175 [bacterium]
MLYEKFDIPNSIFISILLFGFAIIEPTKTVGVVLLEYSLVLLISETLFKLISKRGLKLINLSDLIFVTVLYHLFEVVLLFVYGSFSIDNIFKLIISFVLNTLITYIVLNLVNTKRKNRLAMPRLR